MFNSYSPVQNIIFVTEDEARNYIIPPSSKVLLMSKDSQRFWIKTSDSWGQTTLVPYDFKEVPQPTASTPQGDFITKDDFAKFKEELMATLQSQIQAQEVKDGKSITQSTT